MIQQCEYDLPRCVHCPSLPSLPHANTVIPRANATAPTKEASLTFVPGAALSGLLSTLPVLLPPPDAPPPVGTVPLTLVNNPLPVEVVWMPMAATSRADETCWDRTYLIGCTPGTDQLPLQFQDESQEEATMALSEVSTAVWIDDLTPESEVSR